MEVLNRCGYADFAFPYLTLDGEWMTVCLAKATARFGDGEVGITEIIAGEVALVDEYYGDPANSSLYAENDLAPVKPQSEIYLAGARGYSPTGRASGRWSVSIRVGRLEKTLVVTGERYWRRMPRKGWQLEEPLSATERPIWYEEAYGGMWEVAESALTGFAENPVGVGFVGGPLDGYAELPAPTLEKPDQPIEQPARDYPVAGFGAVARPWQPRLSLAGTCDARWKRERWPLWPTDLDVAFFNAAPADQQYAGFFEGTEEIQLTNLTPERHCRFRLPFRDRLCAAAIDHSGQVKGALMRLDTLVICPEDCELHATWRAGFCMFNPAVIEIRPA